MWNIHYALGAFVISTFQLHMHLLIQKVHTPQYRAEAYSYQEKRIGSLKIVHIWLAHMHASYAWVY